MSGKRKKRKKKESYLKILIQLLIGVGTFLTGLASFIEALK